MTTSLVAGGDPPPTSNNNQYNASAALPNVSGASGATASPLYVANNNTSINTSSNQQAAAAAAAAAAAGTSTRLQFNRLASERKTVHVMNANLKDVTKRDRQMLASYNHGGAAGAASGAAGGAAAGGGGGGGHHHQLAGATGTNLASYPNQNYLNSAGGVMAGHQLDYNMTTGRSHTNTGSFLQKLSSKFSRR